MHSIAIKWTGFPKHNPLMFEHSLREYPHNVNYFYSKEQTNTSVTLKLILGEAKLFRFSVDGNTASAIMCVLSNS